MQTALAGNVPKTASKNYMKNSLGLEKPLQISARLVAGFILVVLTLACRLVPEWDYGLYDKTKFWYAADNFSKEFLVVLLPSVAIVFLLPVIIRGSLKQKAGAIIIGLIAAFIAIPGWLEIIGRFDENMRIIFAH